MNEGGNTALMSGAIDVEMAWNIGKAVAEWLEAPGHVVVVYAPLRQNVAGALIEGLRLQGKDVADRGSGDLSKAREHLRAGPCAGAVVVGQVGDAVTVEICYGSGQALEGELLQRLWEQAAAGNFVPAPKKGELVA